MNTPKNSVNQSVLKQMADKIRPCDGCSYNTNLKLYPTVDNVTEECIGCKLLRKFDAPLTLEDWAEETCPDLTHEIDTAIHVLSPELLEDEMEDLSRAIMTFVRTAFEDK